KVRPVVSDLPTLWVAGEHGSADRLARPCPYLYPRTAMAPHNRRPFEGKTNDALAADALDLKAAFSVRNEVREEPRGWRYRCAFKEPMLNVDPTQLVCLQRFKPGRQIARLGHAQFIHANFNAGNRLALQVEDPAINGHVVLGKPQRQIAGRLERAT